MRRKRAYAAAKTSRLNSVWGASPQPVDADIRRAIRAIRARAREEAQNNAYVARYMQLMRTNVIGNTGIILQSKTKSARAANAIEQHWREWTKHGSPDVSGRFSFNAILERVVDALATDGESILVIHRGFPHNDQGIALELVDCETLDVERNDELRNGNTIRMGVELDRWRRPVAYHFTGTKNTDESYRASGGARRRIEAGSVLHPFLNTRCWQTRGIPALAPVLEGLNMLAGYEEAELVAARIAASKMGFFTRDDTSTSEYTGEEDEAGNLITEVEPGAFEQLPDGFRFQSWDPQHPSTAYGDYIKNLLRRASSGFGISYHTLANDLEGVNYSSARIGSLEDREHWKMLQKWLVDTVCRPVFEAWLEYVLLTGSLKLSAANIDLYKKSSWQPRRWHWVDPQKDITASSLAVENGIRSRSDVIREAGNDPVEVWEEIQKENETLADLGLSFGAEKTDSKRDGEDENDDTNKSKPDDE